MIKWNKKKVKLHSKIQWNIAHPARKCLTLTNSHKKWYVAHCWPRNVTNYKQCLIIKFVFLGRELFRRNDITYKGNKLQSFWQDISITISALLFKNRAVWLDAEKHHLASLLCKEEESAVCAVHARVFNRPAFDWSLFLCAAFNLWPVWELLNTSLGILTKTKSIINQK